MYGVLYTFCVQSGQRTANIHHMAFNLSIEGQRGTTPPPKKGGDLNANGADAPRFAIQILMKWWVSCCPLDVIMEHFWALAQLSPSGKILPCFSG
jgi:hypothetical protein